MKTKKEKNQVPDEAAAPDKENIPTIKTASEDSPSELREPRWSVVSFENRVAKNLTYVEAARKLQELAAAGTSGLCLITDEAAARI